MPFCTFFYVQPKHQNGNIFVDIEGFRPCLSKPSYRAPKWALMVRLMQKERLKSPHKLLIRENQAFWVILPVLAKTSLKDKIRAWMRASLMLNTGMHRFKVGCAFFTGQEWEYMCGYVQKDMGKPHYLFACYPPIEERTCHIYFF